MGEGSRVELSPGMGEQAGGSLYWPPSPPEAGGGTGEAATSSLTQPVAMVTLPEGAEPTQPTLTPTLGCPPITTWSWEGGGDAGGTDGRPTEVPTTEGAGLALNDTERSRLALEWAYDFFLANNSHCSGGQDLQIIHVLSMVHLLPRQRGQWIWGSLIRGDMKTPHFLPVRPGHTLWSCIILVICAA